MYPGGFFIAGDAIAAQVAVVDGSGNQITTFSSVPTPPATATLTKVAAAVTTTPLIAANANRKKLYFYNNSSKTLKIAFAATTSADAFTTIIGANSLWENEENGYTGQISGFWSGAVGDVQITEITP